MEDGPRFLTSCCSFPLLSGTILRTGGISQWQSRWVFISLWVQFLALQQHKEGGERRGEGGGGGRGEIGGRGERCRGGGENEAAEEEEEKGEEENNCVDYYYYRRFNYSQSATQEILDSVLKFFVLWCFGEKCSWQWKESKKSYEAIISCWCGFKSRNWSRFPALAGWHCRTFGQSKSVPWTSMLADLSMSIKPEPTLAGLPLRETLGSLSRPNLRTLRTERGFSWSNLS